MAVLRRVHGAGRSTVCVFRTGLEACCPIDEAAPTIARIPGLCVPIILDRPFNATDPNVATAAKGWPHQKSDGGYWARLSRGGDREMTWSVKTAADSPRNVIVYREVP
jgi:hypothetical protein